MGEGTKRKCQTLDITMIGGGMIAHDQILPSLYHLNGTARRQDRIAARHSKMLRELAEAPRFKDHFPGIRSRRIRR
jgi:hypothetical protein